MTVEEMLGRIHSPELSEWMAYASIEPIGEKRMDLRFAMLACTISNGIRGACGCKKPPLKLKDFLLNFDPPEQQTPDQMKAILLGLGKR